MLGDNDQDLGRYVSKMLGVVSVGRLVQAAGAHYLWGAQRMDGSAPMLPDNPSGGVTGTFMRCASLYQGDTSKGVCAGRYDAPEVKTRPQWDGKDPRAPGPRFRWPRYFEDKSTDNSPKVPSKQVWGEDCTGKLHFDCAGFVRYCFRMALGSLTVKTTMRDESDLVWSADKSRQPIASVPIWPADLLYDDGYSHVGMATGHWLLTGYGVSTPSQALHCYSATVGVVMTPIDQYVRWKYVYRWPKWD